MKRWMLLWAIPFGLAAQDFPVTPHVPPAFETRDVGEVNDGGASITRTRPQTKTRKITYIAVSGIRDWRNTGGQVIQASMLAFDPPPGASKDAALPLVREGRIRLWIEERKKVTEYPLAKLSSQDREFVNQLLEAQKTASKPVEKE
ncbi:hypothetical protein MLD59_12500 [Verrucomicrobiaceae bacterium E54]|nr:hypothetical protein [Verrucomicrobiaceae bacterium E54]